MEEDTILVVDYGSPSISRDNRGSEVGENIVLKDCVRMPQAESKLQDVQATENSFSGGHSSVSIHPEEPDWDEKWKYLSMPEVVPVQGAPPNKAEEDSKIRALVDTPALDWKCYSDSFGAGRGFGHGMGGRSDRRGYGRGGLLEKITPPAGYICHRCNEPGHFIQHCPTNGDPAFDIKRTKPPTGIPKSMLVATQDGSYALPSDHFAVLKPNEDAFEKEIERMPSTHSVGDLPAELYCPLCRTVMKDAVLASKCCFKSFCDKCIRDYIISKSLCFCGATNIRADDLLPNKTLRGTIVRILESNNSSGAKSGSSFQPQDMESARCSQPNPCPKVPSPTLSATSKEDVLVPKNKGNTEVEKMTEPLKCDSNMQKISGVVTVDKGAEVSEAAQECVTGPGSQVCPPVTDEVMKQKQVSGEVGKKRKKNCADSQVGPHHDFAAENYQMSMKPFGYNPYWNHMQPEYDGFGRPYCGQMPFMGYGLGPVSIPFGGAFYHDLFGAQSYMPSPSQRDLAELRTDFNGGDGRDMISQEDVPSAKSKINFTPPERYQSPAQSKRRSPDHITRVPEISRSSCKRKVKHDDNYHVQRPHQHGEKDMEKERRHRHRSMSVLDSRPPVLASALDLPSRLQTEKTISDRKHNASVFSGITSAKESAASKKRKYDSASPSAVNRSSPHRSHRTSNGDHKYHRKNAAAGHDYESSDEDRHFKRRRSRYESSPSPAVKEGRHSNRG
ncbi:hypothetical protein AgCh_019267 [Apium graveolens]